MSTPLSTRRRDAPPRPTLIGRSRDLEALQRQLGPGVLTITGPGGVGKTALVRDALDRQDAWSWLRLREALSQDQLELVLAQRLGPRWRQELTHHVITLDCGAMTPAALAPCVARLSAQGDATLTWLITSRVELGLKHERILMVRPLSCSPTGAASPSDAAALLRAAAQQRGVELAQDDTTLAHLEAIAQELGGVPLALELAAWRLRLVSPEHLLMLLRQDLDVLTQHLIDLTTRHHSYSSVLQTQWDSLDALERDALLRCAALGEEFDLDEACTALECEPALALQRLESLVRRSALLLTRSSQAQVKIAWCLTARREVLRRHERDDTLERARALVTAHTIRRAGPSHDLLRPPPLASATLNALERPEPWPGAWRVLLMRLAQDGLPWALVPRYEAWLAHTLDALPTHEDSPQGRALEATLRAQAPWLSDALVRAKILARGGEDIIRRLPDQALLRALEPRAQRELYALEALRAQAPDRALALWAEAPALEQTRQARLLAWRALALLQARRDDQAHQALQAALDQLARRPMTPAHQWLLHLSAKLALWRGRPDDALRQWSELAMSHDEDTPWTRGELAAWIVVSSLVLYAARAQRVEPSAWPNALSPALALGLRVDQASWWEDHSTARDEPLIEVARGLVLALRGEPSTWRPHTPGQRRALRVARAASAPAHAGALAATLGPEDHALRASRLAASPGEWISPWGDAPEADPMHDLLERSLLQLASPAADDAQQATIFIDLVEDYFEISGQARVSFGHRPKIRRLIEVMTLAHDEQTPQLTTHELIERLWPKEQLSYESALARLYNLVAALRQLGWREVLIHDHEGYTISRRYEVTTRRPSTRQDARP